MLDSYLLPPHHSVGEELYVRQLFVATSSQCRGGVAC